MLGWRGADRARAAPGGGVVEDRWEGFAHASQRYAIGARHGARGRPYARCLYARRSNAPGRARDGERGPYAGRSCTSATKAGQWRGCGTCVPVRKRGQAASEACSHLRLTSALVRGSGPWTPLALGRDRDRSRLVFFRRMAEIGSDIEQEVRRLTRKDTRRVRLSVWERSFLFADHWRVPHCKLK